MKFQSRRLQDYGFWKTHYFGWRDYPVRDSFRNDPAIGRLNYVDPLYFQTPGQSPYNFVANNPVNLYDVMGLVTNAEVRAFAALKFLGWGAEYGQAPDYNEFDSYDSVIGGGCGISTIIDPTQGHWEWEEIETKNYGDYDCSMDPNSDERNEIYIEAEKPGRWVWVENSSDVLQAGLYATTNLFSSASGIFGGLANAVENNRLAFAYKPLKFWPRNAEKYARFLLKNLSKNSKAYKYVRGQLNVFKNIAKFGPWLTMAATGMEISFANDTRAKWQAVGGAIGGYLVGTFGGYLGSHFLPGPGTIVGAIGGATAGNIIGRKVAGFLYDQLGPDIYKYYKP